MSRFPSIIVDQSEGPDGGQRGAETLASFGIAAARTFQEDQRSRHVQRLQEAGLMLERATQQLAERRQTFAERVDEREAARADRQEDRQARFDEVNLGRIGAEDAREERRLGLAEDQTAFLQGRATRQDETDAEDRDQRLRAEEADRAGLLRLIQQTTGEQFDEEERKLFANMSPQALGAYLEYSTAEQVVADRRRSLVSVVDDLERRGVLGPVLQQEGPAGPGATPTASTAAGDRLRAMLAETRDPQTLAVIDTQLREAEAEHRLQQQDFDDRLKSAKQFLLGLESVRQYAEQRGDPLLKKRVALMEVEANRYLQGAGDYKNTADATDRLFNLMHGGLKDDNRTGPLTPQQRFANSAAESAGTAYGQTLGLRAASPKGEGVDGVFQALDAAEQAGQGSGEVGDDAQTEPAAAGRSAAGSPTAGGSARPAPSDRSQRFAGERAFKVLEALGRTQPREITDLIRAIGTVRPERREAVLAERLAQYLKTSPRRVSREELQQLTDFVMSQAARAPARDLPIQDPDPLDE